jgi:hypothetical protein
MRMKKLVLAMSLLVAAAMTFSVASATSKGEPVNKKCPIAKKDIKADAPSSDVKKGDKEYTVGFCCKNCKGKWDAEKDPLAKWPVAEIK